jgi:hypothetical protein
VKISGIVRRLEPGSLWAHISHKNNGALEVAGEAAVAASKRYSVVVCTYGGSIEGELPEEFKVLQVPSQAD